MVKGGHIVTVHSGNRRMKQEGKARLPNLQTFPVRFKEGNNSAKRRCTRGEFEMQAWEAKVLCRALRGPAGQLVT